MTATRAPVSLAAHTRPPAGYDPAWFEVLAQVEERHFWFRARNRTIAAAVRPLAAEFGPRLRLLEVGCGNGNVLRMLKSLCPEASLTGLDRFEEGLAHARRRCDCRLLAGDLLHAPCAPGAFDLVGMFDVLEHLPEDQAALRALYSLLVPGGAVVLTVPACPALWSYFDEVGGHFRRYRRAELSGKLTQTGFNVSYATYFMLPIFPLLWVGRRWAAPLQSSAGRPAGAPYRSFRREAGGPANQPGDLASGSVASWFLRAEAELRVRPGLNGLLLASLVWESWWIARRRELPFGASLLVVARKPAGGEAARQESRA